MWTYDEALDYLYSFINYEVKREVRYAPEVMNLDRPRELLAALGNPQDGYPIIHITGTKGKGSVGAYCQAALQSAGMQAGLYSSPHLQDFRERFRINDTMIEPQMLADLVAQMKPAIDSIPDLTWFELTTALAFMYFKHMAADVVVLEVGLGGRLDATNVVTPVVSVITSLSYDHTHLLGDTLAEIAFEKAGIIKPGVPVVSAPQDSEAYDVLADVAAQQGARLVSVGSEWQVVPGQSTTQGQTFMAGPANALQRYWTPLAGHHQAVNATVALAALSVAREAGVPLPESLVTGGRLTANWPGRFEVVGKQPAMILDAAHNGASATCLRETLAEVLPSASPRVLVYGASADKDVEGMFVALLPMVDTLILTKAEHPRATEPETLLDVARATGFAGEVVVVQAVTDAVRRAREAAGKDGLVTVTGSLFIVGEVRDALGLQPGRVANLDEYSEVSMELH